MITKMVNMLFGGVYAAAGGIAANAVPQKIGTTGIVVIAVLCALILAMAVMLIIKAAANNSAAAAMGAAAVAVQKAEEEKPDGKAENGSHTPEHGAEDSPTESKPE